MASDPGRGEPSRVHRTNGTRRAVVAAAMLALGVVGLGVAAWLLVGQATGDWPGSYRAFAAPGVVGAAALGLGVVRLSQAVRRRDESFEVHPTGLLHRYRGRADLLEWPSLVEVLVDGDPRRSGLRHALGLDIRCRLRLVDGSVLRFDGMTEDAETLAADIAHRSGATTQYSPR